MDNFLKWCRATLWGGKKDEGTACKHCLIAKVVCSNALHHKASAPF